MKIKKLLLNRETVRRLTDAQLKDINGGAADEDQPTSHADSCHGDWCSNRFGCSSYGP